MNTDVNFRNAHTFSFDLPTKIIFQANALRTVPERLALAGKKRALLILTQGSLLRLSSIAELLNNTEGAELVPYLLDHSFKASTEELQEVKTFLKQDDCDSIVSLGGGNVLDFAKVAAICLDENVDLKTVVGRTFEKVHQRLFHIAIPTTFGTGSEITKGAIIKDVERGIKDGVRGSALFPDEALIDPELGRSLPDTVLRETLFDSFTHAFEATQAVKRTRLMDCIAYEALTTINKSVARYAAQQFSAEFYHDIAYGALLGGLCVAHVGTCLPHRFEQAFAPLYSHSHGAGLAAFYPKWVALLDEHNVARTLPKSVNKFDSLSQYVDSILYDLRLDQLEDELKETSISAASIITRITGNTLNDPLVNQLGAGVITRLLQQITGH
ncbi:iron-containing alcohol dehydrogenase family protein [Pseudomonas syringae]|uniref:iron-containing alcohol dehydrogenase family protein n=1 Tax=Pseudomonas syringae TaxID=317 RepID=UPI0004288BD6|nr:iron-containing alcohol dehydrogenase [Pseudomonas syringae]